MSLMFPNPYRSPERLPMQLLPFSIYDSLPKLYQHATGPFILTGLSKIKLQIAWHSKFQTTYPHTTRFRMLRALADNDLAQVSQVLSQWQKLNYDINQPLQPKYNLNALQFAALSNRHAACQLLLLNGARIDYADQYGRTALMWATIRRNFESIHTLVKNGCDIEIKDVYGKTAVDRAEMRAMFNIRDYLVKEAGKQRKRIFPVFTVRLGLEELIKNESMEFVAGKKQFSHRALLSPFNNLKGLYNITFTDYKTIGDIAKKQQN